eukprot:CAMPEP_0172421202 /NCGR_PEP_ID=MMETSP1064-20121228/7469_1 /TAXON_ID=202472 /ORGANISM="Aulacoseira subarctica , Strain CCAP 1002/5" /LENGTH=697 /DNA_ID=CAMNT_0013161489 /DNA_START=20 /DNA_END=2113 /DNA_ORIENTATION=+
MSSVTDWSSIAIKLRVGSHVRRIPVQRLMERGDVHPSFSALQNMTLLFYLEQQVEKSITAHNNLNPKISFSYLDEENESIIFSTSVEFLEALRFSSTPSYVSTTSPNTAIRFLRVDALVDQLSDNDDDDATMSHLLTSESNPCETLNVEVPQHDFFKENTIHDAENKDASSSQTNNNFLAEVASLDCKAVVDSSEEERDSNEATLLLFEENSDHDDTLEENLVTTTIEKDLDLTPPHLKAITSLLQNVEQFVHNLPILPKSNESNNPLSSLMEQIHKLSEGCRLNDTKDLPHLHKESGDLLHHDKESNGRFFDFDPHFVHARHQCDLCKCLPIVGFRWHAICPPFTPSSASMIQRFSNFDLCHGCFTQWRENREECSISFHIPSEIRFRPAQYARDCDFLRWKQKNPFEVCLRKVVRCIPRFPTEPSSGIRLVDCLEVNKGIGQSLLELKRKNSPNPTVLHPVDDPNLEEGNVFVELQESNPPDLVLPVQNVRVVSIMQEDPSLMTGDGDSFQTAVVVEGGTEIPPSINSASNVHELANCSPLEATEISFATQFNTLDTSPNSSNTNERKRSFSAIVEYNAEEAVLNISQASVTLGSLTLSSVTDDSNTQDNAKSHNDVNNSLTLFVSAQEEEMSAPVPDNEWDKMESLIQSIAANTDSPSSDEADQEEWDLVSEEEIFAESFQRIGSAMSHSSSLS